MRQNSPLAGALDVMEKEMIYQALHLNFAQTGKKSTVIRSDDLTYIFFRLKY
jgi:hypothetical protein